MTTIDPDKKAQAVEMYQDGEKTERIYEVTGISRPSLYLLLQQRGISPNRQTDRRTPGLDAGALLQQLKDAQLQLGHARAENELLKQRISVLEAELEEYTGVQV